MISQNIDKTPENGTLPNLIVIGGLKCATTSMYYYFNLHPQIVMSPEKELNFFIREQNWPKGMQWYKSNFKGRAAVYGEVSPHYTNYPFYSGIAERMFSTVPNVKLLYILRDPIDRLLSDYFHHYAEALEERMLSDILKDLERNPYVSRSKYYMQLEQYLKFFPESNIMLVTTEDLYYNRQKTLQRIFRFLNVNDSFYSHKFSFAWYKSKYRRRITRLGVSLSSTPLFKSVKRLPFEFVGPVEKLLYLPFSYKMKRPFIEKKQRQDLQSFLKTDIDCLRKYTGQDFKTWSV